MNRNSKQILVLSPLHDAVGKWRSQKLGENGDDVEMHRNSKYGEEVVDGLAVRSRSIKDEEIMVNPPLF
jgi:hypothetical protein